MEEAPAAAAGDDAAPACPACGRHDVAFGVVEAGGATVCTSCGLVLSDLDLRAECHTSGRLVAVEDDGSGAARLMLCAAGAAATGTGADLSLSQSTSARAFFRDRAVQASTTGWRLRRAQQARGSCSAREGRPALTHPRRDVRAAVCLAAPHGRSRRGAERAARPRRGRQRVWRGALRQLAGGRGRIRRRPTQLARLAHTFCATRALTPTQNSLYTVCR